MSGDFPIVILRHDVDRRPLNALTTAKLENELGIKGTYYFRIVPESFNENIISQISGLGHEIGYHYEDVDLIERSKKKEVRSKENLIDLAWESFKLNLGKLRSIVPVKTICMHGSPLSKYDNRIMWEKYNYKSFGIIGSPDFDIDWNEFCYFTDTGRRWNGNRVSVRDKVISKYYFNFKTTHQIIANVNNLPNKLMINIHPERWNNELLPWLKQLVMQNAKNVVKRLLVKRRK
jgi:hypothetical protein